MIDPVSKRKWICCQIGAREHYAVARAFASTNSLQQLITELWLPPGHPYGWQGRLRGRFHNDLSGVEVSAWNTATLGFELHARILGKHGWPLMIERNRWFQRHALHFLQLIEKKNRQTVDSTPALFAYSYAALEILRFGKQRGWPVFLGQIDPGWLMQERVAELRAQYVEMGEIADPAPQRYWDAWQEECELADGIVVNSSWSRKALIDVGIPAEKLHVLSLAYEPPASAEGFERVYPDAFTDKRPLRVLFLGQVTMLKGIVSLLEAAAKVQKEAIEFVIVGQRHLRLPERLTQLANLHWVGPVERNHVARYYREADVFIFPTHCDGFGMTQLEAQAWRLPVIASAYCGEVVRDGVNGVILKDVSAEAIAGVLLDLVSNPSELAEMARRSGQDNRFNLSSLALSLQQL